MRDMRAGHDREHERQRDHTAAVVAEQKAQQERTTSSARWERRVRVRDSDVALVCTTPS